MLIITIAIFFSMAVIVKSYSYVDSQKIYINDIVKAAIPALIAVICMVLRGTYFSLPEEGMVTGQYLEYRGYLLWGFLAFMAYIIRFFIYSVVYIYRNRIQ